MTAKAVGWYARAGPTRRVSERRFVREERQIPRFARNDGSLHIATGVKVAQRQSGDSLSRKQKVTASPNDTFAGRRLFVYRKQLQALVRGFAGGYGEGTWSAMVRP